MQVLITGGTGLVGWRLVSLCLANNFEVVYTYHTNDIEKDEAASLKLDLRDESSVEKVVRETDPDIVFHTAALTDVDACERRPELATEINVTGTRLVRDACERFGCKLVQFSTASVFDGTKEVYYEHDDKNPINYYGRTKAQAEEIVQEFTGDYLIVRFDQPYCWPETWQNETFVSWLIKRIERDGQTSVFTDWWNTPVYVDELNRALLQLLNGGQTGIFHVVGSDFLSRFEWARIIADVFGYEVHSIEPTDSNQAELSADRPDVHLSNEKVRETAGFEFSNIREGMALVKSRMEGESP